MRGLTTGQEYLCPIWYFFNMNTNYSDWEVKIKKVDMKGGEVSRSDFDYRGFESFETNVKCQTSDIK